MIKKCGGKHTDKLSKKIAPGIGAVKRICPITYSPLYIYKQETIKGTERASPIYTLFHR